MVTLDDAYLFTDGRYHTQAEIQLNPQHWKVMKVGLKDVKSVSEFVTDVAPHSAVGIDPYLTPAQAYLKLESSLTAKNITLKNVATNLVDQIWGTQRPPIPNGKVTQFLLPPPPPLLLLHSSSSYYYFYYYYYHLSSLSSLGRIRLHDLKYAGLSVSEKLASLRTFLNSHQASAIVLSSLDEIMWLFNVRGNDVPCNPVAISYAIIRFKNTF